MNFNSIKQDVQEVMTEKRFCHVLGVVETVTILAENFGSNLELLRMAALLHDFTKELSVPEHIQIICGSLYEKDLSFMQNTAELFHAKTASLLAVKRFGLPEDWAEPIAWHTTGRSKMSINDKLLFIADYIEPNRPWFRPELLELACQDPDAILRLSLSEKICYTIKKQGFVHKDSIDCWNWCVAEKKEQTVIKQKLELLLTG